MKSNLLKSSVTVFFLSFAIYLFTGCAAMDKGYRGVVGVVDPDKMALATDLKWMTPPTNMGLRSVSPDKMAVYLRLKNSAGQPIPGLYETLTAALQQAGYRITPDPAKAHFTMFADVRYFGINKNSDGGASMLTGAVLGGATGAVIGHNVGDGHTAVGAGAGAAAGGAMGKIMANRNKMIEVALAVDLRIGERVEGGVETTRTGTTSAKTSTGVATNIGGGVEGGSSQAKTTDRQKADSKREDFLYHGNRIVATAERMGLTPKEALPTLKSRIGLAMGSVLP
ncbi:MAG: complement resistance protein TraT [Lentisphaeria bacterium]